MPHLEITNFTIANATNVLIECGFACNKNGADCDAMFVQGMECHLLKVGYIYILYYYIYQSEKNLYKIVTFKTKIARWIVH